MSGHEVLKAQEAKKLQDRGFVVEFEKKLGKACVVDVYATRGDQVVIVECGYCPRNLEELKTTHHASLVVHTPYLMSWMPSYLWRKPSKAYNERMNEPYDWRVDMKQSGL